MLTEPLVLLLLAAMLLVVISLAWSAKTPRHNNKKAKNLARLSSSGQYWGVSIRNGNCSASKRLYGRGFRLSEAPSLPMTGCRSLRCPCSYTGLRERRKKERRSNPDRRTEARLGSVQHERRRPRDRRGSFHS